MDTNDVLNGIIMCVLYTINYKNIPFGISTVQPQYDML